MGDGIAIQFTVIGEGSCVRFTAVRYCHVGGVSALRSGRRQVEGHGIACFGGYGTLTLPCCGGLGEGVGVVRLLLIGITAVDRQRAVTRCQRNFSLGEEVRQRSGICPVRNKHTCVGHAVLRIGDRDIHGIGFVITYIKTQVVGTGVPCVKLVRPDFRNR